MTATFLTDPAIPLDDPKKLPEHNCLNDPGLLPVQNLPPTGMRLHSFKRIGVATCHTTFIASPPDESKPLSSTWPLKSREPSGILADRLATDFQSYVSVHFPILLQGIKPSTLAGLLCALVTPFQVSRPDCIVGIDPSEELQALVEDLSAGAVELASAQAQHGILCPIEIDLKCASCFYN